MFQAQFTTSDNATRQFELVQTCFHGYDERKTQRGKVFTLASGTQGKVNFVIKLKVSEGKKKRGEKKKKQAAVEQVEDKVSTWEKKTNTILIGIQIIVGHRHLFSYPCGDPSSIRSAEDRVA